MAQGCAGLALLELTPDSRRSESAIARQLESLPGLEHQSFLLSPPGSFCSATVRKGIARKSR